MTNYSSQMEQLYDLKVHESMILRSNESFKLKVVKVLTGLIYYTLDYEGAPSNPLFEKMGFGNSDRIIANTEKINNLQLFESVTFRSNASFKMKVVKVVSGFIYYTVDYGGAPSNPVLVPDI